MNTDNRASNSEVSAPIWMEVLIVRGLRLARQHNLGREQILDELDQPEEFVQSVARKFNLYFPNAVITVHERRPTPVAARQHATATSQPHVPWPTVTPKVVAVPAPALEAAGPRKRSKHRVEARLTEFEAAFDGKRTALDVAAVMSLSLGRVYQLAKLAEVRFPRSTRQGQ